nr:immunoglobulin light chain junction region [Macaca mulatta]
CLQYNSPPLTF